MATIQPPPQAGDLTSVPMSTGQKIMSGVGGFLSGATGQSPDDSPINKAIKAHNQKQLDIANMHRRTLATLTGVKATGKNPDTGQPLSDQEKQQLDNQIGHVKEAYMKAAGQNKELKAALQKQMAVVDHITNAGAAAGGAGGATGAGAGGGSPAGGGLPPPPAPGPAPAIASDGTATSSGGAAITGAAGPKMTQPPPGAAPKADAGGIAPASSAPAAAGGSDDDDDDSPDMLSINAPRWQQQLDERHEDDRQFAQFKRQQEILKQNKIEENKALAEARASNKSTPRPVNTGSVGVLDARGQAQLGKVYKDTDGDPLDLTALPDSMGLKMFIIKSDGGQWETRYEPFSPNQSSVKVGGVDYEVSPMDRSKIPQGAGVAVGDTKIASTHVTKDPTTGQVTTSTTTPQITGATGRGGDAGKTSTGGKGGTTAPAPRSPKANIPMATDSGAFKSKDPNIPLDSEGHIANGTDVEVAPGLKATPQVIEAANQLIDDRDVDKIPAKVRELGATLARKTGWYQGKFTPKEMTALDEPIAFIDKFLNGDKELGTGSSLKVLDGNWASRGRLISRMAGSSDHQGPAGIVLSAGASKLSSPLEDQFLRDYNQLAQVISGLRKITSPGNNSTEQATQRLLTDLPNPKTTHNSEDARQRLYLLQEEIAIAKRTGNWDHLLKGKGTNLPRPPSAGDTSKAPDPEAKAAPRKIVIN